ncbi:MAG: hypothetical protein JXB47_20910 [Anaerolineae bacterium]|nr:hypothetical protein [Anaerolineae bacterium]
MRRELARYAGQRLRFNATVKRFGSRTDDTGRKQHTACLSNVRVGKRIVAGHAWVDWQHGHGSEAGDLVELTATVCAYEKTRATRRRRGRKRWEKVIDYELVDIDEVAVK